MTERKVGSQPQRGSDTEEPQPDRPLREVRPDILAGDAIEQRQSADPEDDDRDDEITSMPAEASEADVLDQSRSVPLEDEY